MTRSHPGLRIAVAMALGLSLTFSASSNAAQSLALGVGINGSAWEGDNGPGRSDFESDRGGQLALSINYRIDKFYTGLNLQGGEYSFDSDGPDQFTSAGTLSSNDVKVEHNDFDLLVGYYFWPQISLFADLKVAHSDWKDNGYEQAFGGIGFGVSGFHVINSDWILFGSLGFVNGDVDDDDASGDHGDGKSSALTVGSVYQIDPDNTVNFGIKFRKYEFDFDDGNEQEYTLNGLFFGYTHVFKF